jgi:Dolichyl-phosphate-mannose-protein mannosyltransferase
MKLAVDGIKEGSAALASLIFVCIVTVRFSVTCYVTAKRVWLKTFRLPKRWLSGFSKLQDVPMIPPIHTVDAKTKLEGHSGPASDDSTCVAQASDRFASVLLLSLIAWEVGILLLLASRKLFWYDELLTLHFSTLQPLSRFWTALQAGADGMPVGYYLIVRIVNMLSGNPHVILRLPSIIGYILALLGVYWFVRKRLPGIASLTAVVLIILSPFRTYALEARSYALLVGFLAISAALWQRIDDKPYLKPLFALFLALSVCSHYYGVLAISSFAIAEVTWTVLSRRMRWEVWAAFLIGTLPFFLGLPILLRFRNVFGENFWSKPSWSMAVTTYTAYVGLDVKLALVLILFFAVFAGERLLRTLRGYREEIARRDFSLPEISLIGGFLFYPAFLVVLTKVLGGGYVPRYGWPAILGMVLGTVYLLRTSWLQSRAQQFLAVLLPAFIFQAGDNVKQLSGSAPAGVSEPWIRFAELSRAETDVPVVIGSLLTFVEASQYAPPELRQRLVQLVIGRSNRLLAEFIPLKFEDLASFQIQHSRFMFLSGGPFADATTQYLLDKGYRLTLLSEYGGHSLYLAERR